MVVSRADRDAGADDRGLRRSDERPAGGRGLQVWLLKQKQTQDWKTTKATADAVYALLLRGKDILSSDALVQVKLDGVDVTPGGESASRNPKPEAAVEAGTGFYEERFARGEIKPKLGEITVKKIDAGRRLGQRPLAVPGRHEQGHAATKARR